MSLETPPPLNLNRHLSPEPPKHGSTFGVIIIVLLLLALGTYFTFVRLAQRQQAARLIPYIPNGTTTITIIK